MQAGPFSPLLAVAERYIIKACPNASPAIRAELVQIICHLLSGILSYQRASDIFFEKVGTTVPVNRIGAILHVPDSPIYPGHSRSDRDIGQL
jgi:hypothetical protein